MTSTNDPDKLLLIVMEQARNAGIPFSENTDRHVRINTRAKKRFGQCICRNGQYTIEVSSVLLNAPERSCCQTIAHELIHTCKGCGDHGSLSQRDAAIMNRLYGYSISRTNTPEEMGISPVESESAAKYILECRKCGAKISRTRLSPVVAHPSRYRCRCGGSLIRIK